MEWVFLIMNKKELRKKYLNLRSKLSLNESQKAQLSQNLLAVAAKARCNRLFLYKAFKNEINVEDIMVKKREEETYHALNSFKCCSKIIEGGPARQY